MVPELVVLALEYHHAPLRYRHLADPSRPLPKQFSRLISELGSALSAQNRETTAYTLGVTPHKLEQAASFFLRDVLLTAGADNYRVLGLTRQCPPEAIRQHYQLLVSVFHPDRSTSDAERDAVYTARLNDAYHTLRNPDKRARYDQATRQTAAASRSDVDDREFFRPLPAIDHFLGAGMAPAAAGRFPARRVAAVSTVGALALGLVLLVSFRPSHQLPLRASLDLSDQPAPRPAYLVPPEASGALRGQGPDVDKLAERPPPNLQPAARAETVTPLDVPSETTRPADPARLGPLPVPSRDAIRAAALEGRELPISTTPVIPEAIDVAQAVLRDSKLSALSTPRDRDQVPESPPNSLDTTAPDPREARAGSTTPPLAATPLSGEQAPAQSVQAAEVATQASTPTRPPGHAERSGKQSPSKVTEPTLATMPQTPPNASAKDADPSGERKAIAAAAKDAAAPLLETPPNRKAAPAKDSEAANASAPQKSATPTQAPPAGRQSVPAKDGSAAGAEAPKKPAAEPRPSGPPPLSPTDVVNRLMQTYQSGDLDGLMSLFTRNAQINGGRGIAHIRSRYADMFSRLPERRLSIQNLSWRKGRDGRLVGNGDIRVSARTGPQANWGDATGAITLELASAVGGYRIDKMIHRLD